MPLVCVSLACPKHQLKIEMPLLASLSGAFGGKVDSGLTRYASHGENSHPTFPIGLLATAILHMDGVGGLAGWRWIYVCVLNLANAAHLDNLLLDSRRTCHCHLCHHSRLLFTGDACCGTFLYRRRKGIREWFWSFQCALPAVINFISPYQSRVSALTVVLWDIKLMQKHRVRQEPSKILRNQKITNWWRILTQILSLRPLKATQKRSNLNGAK